MCYEDISGYFTDDENECGIPYLIYGRNFSNKDSDAKDKAKKNLYMEKRALEKKIQDEIESERLKAGAKLIASLKSNQDIYRCLIKRLMHENLDYVVNRYFKSETIPIVYKNIIYSDKCIETLIGGMLCKICHIPRSISLGKAIDDISKSTLNNKSNLIPYERVGLIQKFIHETVDAYYGEGARIELPVLHMKKLLSVSRLYLSLHDMKFENGGYYMLIDKMSSLASDIENMKPREYMPTKGKKYYPKWRVTHLKPISIFFKESAKRQIYDLAMLDDKQEPSQYRLLALNIYAKKY